MIVALASEKEVAVASRPLAAFHSYHQLLVCEAFRKHLRRCEEVRPAIAVAVLIRDINAIAIAAVR